VKTSKKSMAAAQRQERFCQEYVIDYNGGRAYAASGYKPGNSNVARVEAHRLLTNPNVRARVAELEAEHLEAIGVRAHRILREQARVAFSDPRQLVGKDGEVLPAEKWTDDAAAAVASVEVVEDFIGKGKKRRKVGQVVKVRFWNKNEAGANLMRHAGMFKEDNAQQGDIIRQFMEAVSGHSRGLPNRR
jgi:phage terminase small subunit